MPPPTITTSALEEPAGAGESVVEVTRVEVYRALGADLLTLLP